MRRGGVAILIAAVLALLAVGPARAANRVYWGAFTKILSANLDGKGLSELGTGGAVNLVEGMAMDPVAGRIYWANGIGTDPNNKILFANLNGAGGGQLNTAGATIREVRGVAIDPVGRRIYWANRGVSRISFANLDGSGGGDLHTTSEVSLPSGVAVDPVSRRIYWVNGGGNLGEAVNFANLEGPGGGGFKTVGATVSNPTGLAIDTVHRRAYWANFGNDTIAFANLDGSGSAFLNTTGAEVTVPQGVAIDPLGGRVYWANFASREVFNQRLSFANLDGSGGGGNIEVGGPDGVGFPLLLSSPLPVSPPTVSGGSGPRSTLSCAQGAWATDTVEAFFYRSPQSFAFQWSRDGTDVPGATGSTLTADARGGEYRCRVTAANAAGTALQTSAPHRVAPQAFGQTTGITLALASPRIPARGPVAVRIANANSFAVPGRLSGRTSKPVASAHHRPVKLGAQAFEVGASAGTIVKLKLPKPLRLALVRRRKLSLAFTASVVDLAGGTRTVEKTLVPKLRR
jgi:DNA-binding beta-propeller fold protein YncE